MMTVRGIRVVMLILAVLAASWPLAAWAEDGAQGAEPTAGRVLVVGTRNVPPFAIHRADGTWEGLAIVLWEELAKQLGLRYRYVEYSLPDLLAGVRTGTVDVAAAALTITSEREARFDFSHAFLSSGLGIAVSDKDTSWVSSIERLLSGPFFRVVGGLLGLLLGIGCLVWLFEHRRNPQFGKGLAGIGAGVWWSAVTMTTVGYGDKAPVTLGGRVVAVIWMFTSVIVISSFTAAIATALTVATLDSRIQGVDDLSRARTATVANSTSAAFLDARHISYRPVPDVGAALAALDAGEIDAVVYDAPALLYRTRHDYAGRIAVLPETFARQDYGIAMPTDSPLRESINQHLPSLLYGPVWAEALKIYQ